MKRLLILVLFIISLLVPITYTAFGDTNSNVLADQLEFASVNNEWSLLTMHCNI